jgi:FkbH-like protein/FkbM family methyltransferase
MIRSEVMLVRQGPPAFGGGQDSVWAFKTGVRAHPYLADHGFQDMMVLPGSLYLDIARHIHQQLFGQNAWAMRQVIFQNPVILSGEETTTILITSKGAGDGVVEYLFHEAANGDLNPALSRPSCAKVEIEQPGFSQQPSTKLCVEDFVKAAHSTFNREEFYRALRNNGNQSGPHFQNVQGLWRAGGRVLGKISVPRAENSRAASVAWDLVLDSITQVLGAFGIGGGRTFVLSSIDRIELGELGSARSLWALGTLRPAAGPAENGFVGDIEVMDDRGEWQGTLTGVRLSLLERLQAEPAARIPEKVVAIAATFTAEPIEDSLRFWGEQLGAPVMVKFAPYNQVFQELLSPGSLLRQNREGLNAILLRLEDWLPHRQIPKTALSEANTDACFKGLERFTLPNGLKIAHLNRYETEYVYQEIFEDRCYLRHGIRLKDEAVVVDIGANIGLFSLFAANCCPTASIYAFEPSPQAFRVLEANCRAYGPRFHPYNMGVSDRPGNGRLTFYPNSSVFSSFHADPVEDRRAIQAVAENMLRKELGTTAEAVGEYARDLTTARLERQVFECPLVGVSDIIRRNALTRVDLLKVDAEKSELEILRGIEENHWPLIGQVVVEVHDSSRKTLEAVKEILERRGFRCAVEEEKLLAGSGLYNVYATRARVLDGEAKSEAPSSRLAELRRKADEFIAALGSFAETTAAPVVLCVCPGTSTRTGENGADEDLQVVQRELLERARGITSVCIIAPDTLLSRYGVEGLHDPHAHELGHIPYTPEGFAAIGTSLFRAFAGLGRKPYKAIVLDCDNTLWGGACGEEGPAGVEIGPSHRALQEFIVEQANSGMLVCLCSKNNEADVWEVFAKRPEMALRREHLAAWRINWNPKSQNLRSLAQELNVGMDSLIFIDDNPVECQEARSSCPEVLTLQLPRIAADNLRFLQHVWAFDHFQSTEEDRQRTKMFQQDLRRKHELEQAPSLKDFIEGLGLQVTIGQPSTEQLARVAQLTQRTNQFNLSTLRRSEQEIVRFLQKEDAACLAAEVSDRFGEYGLVGVVLCELGDAEICRVETFLLSCRVLGRGVEHQVLAEVARRALAANKKWIDILYRPSGKNQPAWDFINSLSAQSRDEIKDGTVFRFAAENLATLHYDPDAKRSEQAEVAVQPARQTPTAAALAGASEHFQRIADELRDLAAICSSIERYRMQNGDATAAPSAGPATSLEEKLLNIWRRVLANGRLGPAENFFEAGGTSLKAVLAVAAVRRELNLNLSVVSLFESPTVRLLCEKLQAGNQQEARASAALERGARRKRKLQRELQ